MLSLISELEEANKPQNEISFSERHLNSLLGTTAEVVTRPTLEAHTSLEPR